MLHALSARADGRSLAIHRRCAAGERVAAVPQLTPVNALQVIEQGRRQTRKRLPTRAAVEEKEERLGEMQRLVHAADTRRRYRVWSVMHTIANPVPVRIRNKAE